MIYLKEIIKKFDKYIEDKNKRKKVYISTNKLLWCCSIFLDKIYQANK